MDVLVGLYLLISGAAFLVAGLRLWTILLPFLGFFAGVSAGIDLMYWFFDWDLFAAISGVIVGVLVGIVFAALAYFFWYIGVLLAAGFVGAVAGAGLMRAIDVESGLVISLAAILGALIPVFIATLFPLPEYIVVTFTAFAGSTWAVAGLMLILGVIDRSDLIYGPVVAAINESWFWAVVWLAVSGVGMVLQLRDIQSTHLPSNRWAPVRSPRPNAVS